MTSLTTRHTRNTSVRFPHSIVDKIARLNAIQNRGKKGYLRLTKTYTILTAMDAGLEILLEPHATAPKKRPTTARKPKRKRTPK